MGVSGIVGAVHEAPLRDHDGLLLGRVEDLLFDAVTNRPAWVVVRRFARGGSFTSAGPALDAVRAA